jgi:metallo-beta-lactamase family protein
MKISFHGADQGVTGSCHLVECAGKRILVDGASRVSIFGEQIDVRASVHTIGGFSAHADQAELLAWHAHTGKPRTTYLVHGEEKGMRALASKIDSSRVEIPGLHQEFELP